MATFNSPTDVVAGSLAKSADLNNLDAAVAVAFALLPPNENIEKGTINYAVDTGVANAYVVALPKAPTSYTDGLQVIMKALYSNTGASTVNVDSLGIKAIKTEASENPTAGDITAGVPMELRYSTTTGYFHMIKSSATAASQSAAQAAAASAAAALVSQNAAAGSAAAAAVSAAAAAGVMTTHTNTYNHANIETAFGWGNHASAGYLTSVNLKTNGGLVVETGAIAVDLGASAITGTLAVGDGGTGVATSGTTEQIAVGGGTTSAIVWTTATGTGAPVRANSPTLVTPVLGTPASGNLANCTGFPTGVTYATAAEINVGTEAAKAIAPDQLKAAGLTFATVKMLFYMDTAPLGWTLLNTLDDKIVYVTKGSAAGGQTGGAVHSAGTWTQPSHTHSGPSHTHTGPSHTHTGPNHAHTGPSHSHSGPSHSHGVNAANTGGPSSTAGALPSTDGYYASTTHVHSWSGSTDSQSGNTGDAGTGYTGDAGTGATGSGGTGATGSEGTGATGSGATANTWRPAAYSMIICSKD